MADYSELPSEILLRIFMQSDKGSLLALRLVSTKCNTTVMDTPLGNAWDYAIRIAENNKKRMLDEPIAHPDQRGVNVGGTILNLLYNDLHNKSNKKPKLHMKDQGLDSLLDWMNAEKHKRAVLTGLNHAYGHHERVVTEAKQLVDAVEFIAVSKHHNLRASMYTKFGFPLQYLHQGTFKATQLVVTVEWNVRQGQNVTSVATTITFNDGDMDWPLLESDHEGNTSFDPTGAKVLWTLLDPSMFLHELIHTFQIFGMASYVEEVQDPTLYHFQGDTFEIVDLAFDLDNERMEEMWANNEANQENEDA